jgi:hypothetical protein
VAVSYSFFCLVVVAVFYHLDLMVLLSPLERSDREPRSKAFQSRWTTLQAAACGVRLLNTTSLVRHLPWSLSQIEHGQLGQTLVILARMHRPDSLAYFDSIPRILLLEPLPRNCHDGLGTCMSEYQHRSQHAAYLQEGEPRPA